MTVLRGMIVDEITMETREIIDRRGTAMVTVGIDAIVIEAKIVAEESTMTKKATPSTDGEKTRKGTENESQTAMNEMAVVTVAATEIMMMATSVVVTEIEMIGIGIEIGMAILDASEREVIGGRGLSVSERVYPGWKSVFLRYWACLGTV